MKIYVKGNYLFIDNGVQLFEGLAKNILVTRYAGATESFYFKNVNGFNDSEEVLLTDIQKEDGSAYTLTEFITFYTTESGKSSATNGGSDLLLKTDSGYSRTSAFVDSSVNYTTQDVASGLYKVLSFNETQHLANDNPYWSTPTPSGTTGIGLFQGANLPEGVSSLMDYNYVFNNNYPSDGVTGFEGSTGRIKLNDCQYGDQIRVRFDFNVIPQISNTTVEPALWYSNRDDNDDITFTFPLTAQPIFYGGGTVGNSYLNRVEISAWITSNEDVNALALPAIKSDNPVIIEPIGILITVIR